MHFASVAGRFAHTGHSHEAAGAASWLLGGSVAWTLLAVAAVLTVAAATLYRRGVNPLAIATGAAGLLLVLSFIYWPIAPAITAVATALGFAVILFVVLLSLAQ